MGTLVQRLTTDIGGETQIKSWREPGREVFQVSGTARANVLRQECAWHAGGTVRRPVWLEQNQQGGEREREWTGAGCSGPVGPGKAWNVTPGV